MAAARSRLWVWVLTILLLALLVWVVGNRVARGPRAEVGVTGADAPPPAPPLPTPVEERAGRSPGDSAGAIPDPTAAGPRSDAVGGSTDAPASPAPRR